MGIFSRIRRGKTVRKRIAVVLVDMQKYFVGNLRSGESERIIPNQLAILKYCNQFDIPVVVLEADAYMCGETIEILLSEAKKNRRFHLIKKEGNNGFSKTELDSHLKSLGARKLFIMGINANYCVKETAYGAIENGYEIMTSNEVISGQSHHSRDNSVDWFKSNGGYIDTVNELVEKFVFAT